MVKFRWVSAVLISFLVVSAPSLPKANAQPSSNSNSASEHLNWTYQGAKILVTGEEEREEPVGVQLTKLALEGLMAPQSPTSKAWGVDQIYVDRGLGVRVFLKKAVRVSNTTIEGAWLKLDDGYVLHLKVGPSLWAFYAEGLNQNQRDEFKRAFRNFYQDSRTARQPLPRSSLVAILTFTEFAGAKETGPSGIFKKKSSSGEAADVDSIEDRAVRATRTGKDQQAGDAILCARDVLSGVWAATGKDAVDLATSIWSALTDPAEAWRKTKLSFQQTIEFVKHIQSEIRTAVQSLKNMPPSEQTKLACQFAGEMGIKGLRAFLSGGAGLANLATSIRDFVRRVAMPKPRVIQSPPSMPGPQTLAKVLPLKAPRERVTDLILKDGELIGRKVPKNIFFVRELPGGDKGAREWFEKLSEGGETIATPAEGHIIRRLEDGTTIGYRQKSKSGPPSIDINLPPPAGESKKSTYKFKFPEAS